MFHQSLKPPKRYTDLKHTLIDHLTHRNIVGTIFDTFHHFTKQNTDRMFQLHILYQHHLDMSNYSIDKCHLSGEFMKVDMNLKCSSGLFSQDASILGTINRRQR
jgi:hypothetical protein